MKITIYELLGLVKDGKMPKKIKFNNIYCYYRECKNEYVDYTNKPIIQWDYVVMNSLNDTVEILEEENEIPEKLENEKEFYAYTRYEENKNEIDKVLYILKAINLTEEKIDNLNNSINSIIDYLKSKGDE